MLHNHIYQLQQLDLWSTSTVEPLYCHLKATQHSATCDNTGKQRHKLSTVLTKCQLHSRTSLLQELSARTSALYQGWTRTEVPHLKWQLSSQWAASEQPEPPVSCRSWAASEPPIVSCLTNVNKQKSCDLSQPISNQHTTEDGGSILNASNIVFKAFSTRNRQWQLQTGVWTGKTIILEDICGVSILEMTGKTNHALRQTAAEVTVLHTHAAGILTARVVTLPPFKH